GDFGSTLVWRHVTRTENVATGEVTVTTSDTTFRGAVVDPIRVEMFGADTLAQSSSALIVPGSSLPAVPVLTDRVSMDGGTTFRVVVEVKTILGPGDAAAPVVVAYAIALGGVVEVVEEEP